MTMSMTHTLPRLRVALLLLCTAGVGATLYAQDGPPPPDQQGQQQGGGYGRGGGRGMGGERQIEMMTKQLNLSTDQVTAIKKIDGDSREKMMALRQDTTSDPADRRKQMGAIMKAREDSIKGVLNDDQKVKYAAMQERMHERREEHGGPGGPGGPGGQDAPPPPPPQN